jgi:hypothetical protein
VKGHFRRKKAITGHLALNRPLPVDCFFLFQVIDVELIEELHCWTRLYITHHKIFVFAEGNVGFLNKLK